MKLQRYSVIQRCSSDSEVDFKLLKFKITLFVFNNNVKFNYATKLSAGMRIKALDLRKGESKTNGRCRHIRNILLFHLKGKFLACQFSISAAGLSLTEIFFRRKYRKPILAYPEISMFILKHPYILNTHLILKMFIF